MYIKNKIGGYTLIELIITTVLIGIVSSILAYIMVSIIDVLQENRIRKQLLMDGYNASAKFVREFELLENESNLLLANSNQIRFISNIDGVYYTLTYQITGSELQRSVGGGSAETLCTNISGQFEYYTKDLAMVYAPLTVSQMVTVRRVRLVLNMLDGGGTTRYNYTIDAFPENYRFSGGGS